MPENHTPPGPGGSQDQSPGETGGPQHQGAPPPPEPPPPAASSGGDKSLMLILSYLGLLAIIPLLVDKDQEVQWHAKNGLVLLLTIVAIVIVTSVLAFVPVLGGIVGCLVFPLSTIGYLVVIVIGIMKALKGEKLRLPVLSDLVDQW